MLRPNQMVFDSRKYSTQKEFWEAVSDVLRILTDNGYDVEVYYEDCGIYCISYDKADPNLSDFRCCWLTNEEAEEAYVMRANCSRDE